MSTKTSTSNRTARASRNHSPRTGLVQPETEVIDGAEVLAGTNADEVAEALAEVATEEAVTPTKAPAKKAAKATTKAVKTEMEPAKKAKTSRQLTEEKLAEGGHAGYVIAHHYFGTSWTVKDAEGKGFLFNRETGEMVEDTPEARKALKPVK